MIKRNEKSEITFITGFLKNYLYEVKWVYSKIIFNGALSRGVVVVYNIVEDRLSLSFPFSIV